LEFDSLLAGSNSAVHLCSKVIAGGAHFCSEIFAHGAHFCSKILAHGSHFCAELVADSVQFFACGKSSLDLVNRAIDGTTHGARLRLLESCLGQVRFQVFAYLSSDRFARNHLMPSLTGSSVPV
jgi:hypothetical protein